MSDKQARISLDSETFNLKVGEYSGWIPVKFKAACDSSPVLTGIHTLQAIKYSSQTTGDTPIDATPTDAAEVHREIRAWLAARGAKACRILYGGSVTLKNAAELLAERELDGVLVGGASLDPETWGALVRTAGG